MSTSSWDPVAVKALLRLTAQRLGQLQGKKDSETHNTRSDIAALLNKGNVSLARAKTQNLLHEDAIGDVLEVLEMQVGVILERLGELESGKTSSPPFVEAASTIIYAAPRIESKDLNVVRDVLVQRMDPNLVRSITGNYESYVSLRVTQGLSTSLPSAEKVNNYLMKIAEIHGIRWQSEPLRQDIVSTVSEILDIQLSPLVDLPRLRKLCAQGLPDDPPWLRPRIWKLFFGILPVLKSSWGKTISKQRESYYDLVRRLLPPLAKLHPPTTPPSGPDATLVNVANSISRLPPNLFRGLAAILEESSICPLDGTADEKIRIDCAGNLDSRLELIGNRNANVLQAISIPDIRLEANVHDSEILSEKAGSFSSRRPGAPASLPSGKVLNGTHAKPHAKHISALHRLLYLHSCLNPANQSPHIPSILVPLYSVLLQEAELEDVAHAEADTFWLFEAVIGEVSELEDEEGAKVWMKKISERLVLVDPELAADLHAKGLDPALPHYSYHWLACLLTQTLPLSSVLPIWDALFSLPTMTRDANPKLEFLVDMCTSLLTRARAPLLRLGKSTANSHDLWAAGYSRRPPSPLRPWELSDAFLQGMNILKLYPIAAAGGIDGVLRAASDLANRRDENSRNQKAENLSLGARIKDTMWRGFTNQVTIVVDEASPEEDVEEDEEDTDSGEEDTHDEGDETETPSAPGLTSRLANTVWRGITNQSSMEAPPSPTEPLSPASSPPPSLPTSPSPVPNESLHRSPSPQPSSPLWSYAGKLTESDTVAAFAKVSTNWRAKAMDAWASRKGSVTPVGLQSPASTTSELSSGTNKWMSHSQDRLSTGSLPANPVSVYSPPPRPKHFRSPRESFLPQPRRMGSTAPSSPELSAVPENNFVHKTKASLASLAGLQTLAPPPPPPPKAGPRPLLLNSHSLITAKASVPSRSETSTPVVRDQWSEVLKAKTHALRQGSMSSVSSLSPSEPFGKVSSRAGGARSDWDSDGGRKVPINRKSVSPMAPVFRLPHERWMSPRSSVSGALSDVGSPFQRASHQNRLDSIDATQGWRNVDNYDSPATVSSPPVPPTPITIVTHETGVVITNGEHHQGPASFEPDIVPLSPVQARRARKKTPPPAPREGDTSDSSSFSQVSKSPRVRSKRFPSRPANLRIRENSRPNLTEQRSPSSQSLVPVWPEDHDLAPTPRAVDFGSGEPSSASPTSPRSFRRVSPRKTSGDGSESRSTDGQGVLLRKISTEGATPRVRKVSTGSREARRSRDSAAEEGDDEGYDDLLSAYESEESGKKLAVSCSENGKTNETDEDDIL